LEESEIVGVFGVGLIGTTRVIDYLISLIAGAANAF
jgi:hypothetical protein